MRKVNLLYCGADSIRLNKLRYCSIDLVMKHRHLMQWTGSLIPVLSLRSTHVTIVQSTRETRDIDSPPERGKSQLKKKN